MFPEEEVSCLTENRGWAYTGDIGLWFPGCMAAAFLWKRKGECHLKGYLATGIFWIFGFLLVSLGFLGGYYAMQNFFAVPGEVLAFVKEYQEGKGQQGEKGDAFVDLKEIWQEQNGSAAPAAVRLDIFYVLKEEPEAFVSVLDAGEGTWSLYTFPSDAHVVLGETRYRRLSARFPALPQMFEIGILKEYMGEEQAAGVLAEVLSDMLFCSFKTVVACTEEEIAGWCEKSGGKYVPTQEIMEFFGKNPQQRQVWEKFAASKDVELGYYAETIGMMRQQDIRAQEIAGQRESDGYRLDENTARRQMAGSGL